MASRQSTVDYILEQMRGAGPVSARKMFGEYGVYLGDMIIGGVHDDRLFVKATAAGRALAAGLEEAPPYPGAKPGIVVPAERLEDAAWLSELIRLTAAELPPPRPKKVR